MIPPDKARCQAEKKVGAFVLGGRIGERTRCSAEPSVIVTEVEPGKDGEIGSMSLCKECFGVFQDYMKRKHVPRCEVTEVLR